MPQFARGHNAQGKTTLYDMEVDSGQKHVLTACQDRNIRVYNVTTGKHSKTFKGSVGEDGSLIKVVLGKSNLNIIFLFYWKKDNRTLFIIKFHLLKWDFDEWTWLNQL